MKRRLLNAFKRVHQVPGIKHMIRPMVRRKMNKIIDSAADHFFEHFTLVVANDEQEQRTCYKTRHQVYCEEMKFEDPRPNGMEFDEFDEFALSCYIKHKATGDCAGTIRIVMPQHAGQLLPIEQNCSGAIRLDEHSPQRYPRYSVCEISRLAIPKQFRRRSSDNSLSPVTGKSLNNGFKQNSPGRNFPYLSLALYFFAASICVLRDIENVYVMMEPRLARSLRMLGINFEQLGGTIDYHGQRAAYQISPMEFMQQITPSLQRFQRKIMTELEEVPNFGAIFRHQPNIMTKINKEQRAA